MKHGLLDDRLPVPTERAVDLLAASPKLREIVDGAAGLFDREGYHRVSMEDIASAVGLRKPSLYHYVRSKDQILALIHHEFMELVIQRQESREGVGMSASQRLLEVIADILELMETHRGHVRVFFEHYRELPDEEQRLVRQERDRYEASVERVIEGGIRAAEFRPVDVRLTTLALFGMCNWAYQWYRQGGRLRTREIGYQFWELFLRGIETDVSSPRAAGGGEEGGPSIAAGRPRSG
jgi:AcrR family transcriptional regulator